jgi:hypothetical protein
LLGDIATQVAIGCEDNSLIGRDLLDNFYGVGTSTDNVAESLNFGAAIDVRNNDVIRVLGFEGSKFIGWAAIGQRATGF